MTTDLWMLVGAAALQWVLILAAAGPRMLTRGIPWSLGNRDGEAAASPLWAKRVQRASDNLQENLPLFAILVLVVHVSGEANDTSAMGAIVFVAARVAHALLYAVGVPVLRTGAWTVSIIGLVMVALALT